MSRKCPSCGATVSDTAKFCRECGTKIIVERPIFCSECGAKCKSTYKFCEECGYNLLLERNIFGDTRIKDIGGTYENISNKIDSTVQHKEIYLDDLLSKELDISHFYKEITIPVGISDGEIYYFATSLDSKFSKYKASPNAIIAGASGTGKSSFFHTIILSGASCYSPDELQFYIVDGKSYRGESLEYSRYLKQPGEHNFSIPHVREVISANDSESFDTIFNKINAIIDERSELFVSVGAMNFISYNSDPNIQEKVKRGELPHLPQIYFIFDEYFSRTSKRDTESKLNNLILRTRAFGISFVISEQTHFFKGSELYLLGNSYNFINNKRGMVSARMTGTECDNLISIAFAGGYRDERGLAIAQAIREKCSTSHFSDDQKNKNEFLFLDYLDDIKNPLSSKVTSDYELDDSEQIEESQSFDDLLKVLLKLSESDQN